jgi:starch-binding outer membrane protein, SusD/RagB family
MKNIILMTMLMISTIGCQEYLDVTPREGGVATFDDVIQYDALLNNIRVTRNRVEWANTIAASDDCEFIPELQNSVAVSGLSNVQAWESYSTWNESYFQSQGGGTSGFVPFLSTYSYMYLINQIINTIDNPEVTGDAKLKKKVKAEAKFFRGLYHFLLAVEYCTHPSLNGGNNPGIGYRNSVSTIESGVESRNTVKFTFDNLLKDLEEAKQELQDVGATTLDTNTPWRITVPAAESLLARVYLYLGDYKKAFDNAKSAYNSYKFLYDLNNQTLFAQRNLTVQTETFNGVVYSVTPSYPAIAADQNANAPTSNSNLWYKESYFRFVSQFSAQGRMIPTKELYDSYEAVDLRKKVYYDNNNNISTTFLPPRFKDQLASKNYLKNATGITGSGYLLGVTVPEIMLIMAECRARNAGDGENAGIILKELRKKRFPANYVDNINGTLDDVKSERRRELAMVMRWHDLKRYNALDNANITVTKRGRLDPLDFNSQIFTFKLAPNAPSYALPIIQREVDFLGWQQNEYGGITKQ